MYSVKPTSINNKDRLFRRNKKDLHLKFIVIGDSRVGKTTLVEKYCGYDRDKNQNNSQLYYQHTLTTAEWSCNLKIVDTAGKDSVTLISLLKSVSYDLYLQYVPLSIKQFSVTICIFCCFLKRSFTFFQGRRGTEALLLPTIEDHRAV